MRITFMAVLMAVSAVSAFPQVVPAGAAQQKDSAKVLHQVVSAGDTALMVSFRKDDAKASDRGLVLDSIKALDDTGRTLWDARTPMEAARYAGPNLDQAAIEKIVTQARAAALAAGAIGVPLVTIACNYRGTVDCLCPASNPVLVVGSCDNSNTLVLQLADTIFPPSSPPSTRWAHYRLAGGNGLHCSLGSTIISAQSKLLCSALR